MGAVDGGARAPRRARPRRRSSASTATCRRCRFLSSRPAAVAGALARINEYPHGGYPELDAAIAAYAGVESENIVLGAGADDLILLIARAFAGEGDTVAIAEEPTYPLYRIAAGLAGATVGDDDPVLTFCCRPNNPIGSLDPLPAARPLVVDEAYFEYCGDDGVAGLLDDGVVVIRTFSKAFALAGARVGYALAAADVAAELNTRQAPLAVSTLSAALALAALASPPDVGPLIEERERLAEELRALGYEPLPSQTNFLYVPVDDSARDGRAAARARLRSAVYDGAIRITVRDREDDDLILAALAGADRADRAQRPSRARDRGDGDARAARARRREPRARRDRRRALRPLPRAARVPRRTRPRRRRERRRGDGRAPHGGGHRDRARRGARPRARRPRGIARYGDAVVPMDDALARAAVDLGGRRGAEIGLEHDPGLARHVLESLADSGRLCSTSSRRDDDRTTSPRPRSRRSGRALRAALRQDGELVPSTKGIL